MRELSFDAVLVANRGEIAVRVLTAAREAGLRGVAVFSDADAKALHVELADEAIHLPGETLAETYLNSDAIIAAAQSSGAQAIHPGYGFLSERADFASAVKQAGLVWIGPPPEAISMMGDKISARLKMMESGVPVIPGEELTVPDGADHLGQHGLWQKSDLFEGSARVPLILSIPGMKNAGQSSNSLAELIDLYPTLAGLCGLAKPAHLNGVSLMPVLNNPKAKVRQAAFTVTRIRGKIPGVKKNNQLGHTIRTERYRYTEWGDGKHGVELYDYKSDPDEYTNLAKRDSAKKVFKRMQRLMQATRAHTR